MHVSMYVRDLCWFNILDRQGNSFVVRTIVGVPLQPKVELD